VHLHSEWDLPSGHAALFEVAVPRRTLRVLMVDLESALNRVRTPSIEQVARYTSHTPVDLVLGDFNSTARFRGFDALEDNGYRRAALWSGAWRATWPSVLPLLDIDHVWVHTELDVVASRFFQSTGIDHRGQRTTLRLAQ
jgi:endonuclease/exonuclease/phosphatase family metal-dependent hydrolase